MVCVAPPAPLHKHKAAKQSVYCFRRNGASECGKTERKFVRKQIKGFLVGGSV